MSDIATGLAGRVVVVTGGTRGIGLATAEALAQAGATVVVTGRDEQTAKAAAAALAGKHGVTVSGVGFDVADFAATDSAFKAIAQEHGRIDGLVANAGILEAGVIGMIRPEQVERLFATNVTGTLISVQAAARVMMRKRSGS